jgi:DMSO/TMAO reductase YedYZ molybdopterin-dependent catalytic subunit
MHRWTRRDVLRLGFGGSVVTLLAACAKKSGATVPPALSSVVDGPTPPQTPTPSFGPTSPTPSGTAVPPDTPAPTATRTPTVAPSVEPSPEPRPTYPPFEYESDVTITPIDDFYKVTYHPQPPPTISDSDFRLRIFGAVEDELNLSLDDLHAMPVVEDMRTLECIGNPVGGKLIGNAVWRGVPTAHLLELAGVLPRARELKFECADGYHTSISVQLAMDPHSFLAYWMNGVPLPPKHGYPLRALWPGRYGQKQPKWITGIDLVTEPHLGHWERQGWSNEAIIVPNSRIDDPKKTDVVQLPVFISGIAFANTSGVEKLEVSTDNGATWHDAELTPGPSPRVWTEWRHQWQQSDPGSYVIRARVTDGEGRRQHFWNSRLLGGIKPNGTDEQHSLAVTVQGS